MSLCSDSFEAARALARLYGCLDERDYEGVAACFTPACEWRRKDRLLTNREAIVQALRGRSATLVVHHAFSNCLFEPLPTGGLTVRYLLTVYQVDPGQRAEAGPLVATPPQVGFCDAELEPQGKAWLVRTMQARKPTFTAGPWSHA